jgi:hypothetical protein
MITFKQTGKFRHVEGFFKRVLNSNNRKILEKYGKEGVSVLESVTPIDSGLTAGSWGYDIHTSRNSLSLYWTNSNMVNGTPIVILLQYGHGLKQGGFVQGKDFINPAIRPIFDKIANELWREVTNQ